MPDDAKEDEIDGGHADDFCADCDAEIWRHGQSSVTIDGKSYCSKCAERRQ